MNAFWSLEISPTVPFAHLLMPELGHTNVGCSVRVHYPPGKGQNSIFRKKKSWVLHNRSLQRDTGSWHHDAKSGPRLARVLSTDVAFKFDNHRLQATSYWRRSHSSLSFNTWAREVIALSGTSVNQGHSSSFSSWCVSGLSGSVIASCSNMRPAVTEQYLTSPIDGQRRWLVALESVYFRRSSKTEPNLHERWFLLLAIVFEFVSSLLLVIISKYIYFLEFVCGAQRWKYPVQNDSWYAKSCEKRQVEYTVSCTTCSCVLVFRLPP